MSETYPQPPFPIFKASVVLTVTGAACFGVSLWITAMPLLVGVTAASVWLLAMVGLAPVAMLGHRGVMPTVAGYFVGMFVRLIGCLGGFLLVMAWTDLPTTPIVSTLAATYLPLLVVEAAIVGRYLWRKDFLDRSGVEAAAC